MAKKINIEDLPSGLRSHIDGAPNIEVREVLMNLMHIMICKSKSHIQKAAIMSVVQYLFDISQIKSDLEYFLKKEENNCSEDAKNDKEDDKLETQINDSFNLSSTPTKEKIKKICRFFKNRDKKCKFGSQCKFLHPEKCEKFVKFGFKKYNQKGCEGKYLKIHPRGVICKYNLRGEMCLTKDCKDKHIKVFKKAEKESTKVVYVPSSMSGIQNQVDERVSYATVVTGGHLKPNQGQDKDQFQSQNQKLFQQINRVQPEQHLNKPGMDMDHLLLLIPVITKIIKEELRNSN